MSSTLALSSPLIGSWADQPVDERQSALMAATQEAANARRAAAAAKAAAQNKTTAPAPAATAASASSSSSPATAATDGAASTAAPASSSAAVIPVVYSATFIDPAAPMSAAFQAKHAALSAAAAVPSSEGGAPGGWNQVGKLKEMARTVFERAYGLNGAVLTDHEQLCEEVCLETQCSRKSFCELIYGHSYAAELTDLRALVPGYRPKEKRKREASERGRGGAKKDAAAAAVATAEQTNDTSSGGVASSNGNGHTNGHAAPAAASAASASAPVLARVPSPAGHSTVHLIPVPSSPSLRAHASHPSGKLPLQGNTLLTTSPLESHPAATTQYTFNGQPIQQHPIIHLTHRLIPSVHSNQANAALLNAVTQQPPAQLVQAQGAAAPAAHSVLVPVPNARFAPPPPSGPRRPSPGPSPLLKPRESPLSPTGPVPVGSAGSASAAASAGGVLSPPGRRSVDASSAMRAAVAAANSVSPHLQSLGDPTLNPPLPMVPSSPSLQPVKGSELRNQQAKAVGSPLRQSMNAQMAAAVLQGGSANLPPRASPSLNPMRTPYAHPPLPPQPQQPTAAAPKTAGFAPASTVSPSPAASAPVAAAPMSFAAAVASKTPVTTTITPKPSAQAHVPAAAPVAAAAAVPSASSASTPAAPSLGEQVSKALARPARVRALSATMRDEDGTLVPVSPVPEEAEPPADSPQLAAAAPASSSSSAAASASSAKKKPSKKQRAKDKKRAEEAAAAAAAATAVPASSSPPAVAAAASSSEEESPSGSSRSAKKKAAASGSAPSHPKPKRKFSATPPSSPPLYAMSHDAAAALAAASGSSSSSVFSAASAVVPSFGSSASSSSSFLRLVLWLGAFSLLFIVARSLLCTALYGATSDASGSASQSWSLIAALYVCSVFLFGWLFRCAHEANAAWGALVLELSNQLEKYVTVWELLAVDDPAQLLAAINQIQQLLDAALASFCGLSSSCGLLSRAHALSALDHAVQTMDFLHLAHRNLISELGSTQPIMRLVASLGTVRNKIMQIRSKMPEAPGQGQPGGHAQSEMEVRPLTLMLLVLSGLNLLLLLLAPPLSTAVLNMLLPLGLMLALSVLVMVVWSAQYPFAASPVVAAAPGLAAAQSSSFPATLISAALGSALLVSLEPLHYLRTRLGEREAETKQRMEDAQQTLQSGEGTEAPSPLSSSNAQQQMMHELEDEEGLAEDE